MSARSTRARVEDLVQEVDMLVYSLERPAGDDPRRLQAERDRLRRELEQLRDVLDDLAREL